MELIFAAIAALVVLSGVDAHLWPRPAPRERRRRAVRCQPRRVARRWPAAPRPALRCARSSSQLYAAPRWWWE